MNLGALILFGLLSSTAWWVLILCNMAIEVSSFSHEENHLTRS